MQKPMPVDAHMYGLASSRDGPVLNASPSLRTKSTKSTNRSLYERGMSSYLRPCEEKIDNDYKEKSEEPYHVMNRAPERRRQASST